MDVLLSYFKVVLPRSFDAVVSNVLFGIFQEIEGGVGGCCLEPFSLAYVRVFGQQVTHANGFCNRISVNLVTPLFNDRLIRNASILFSCYNKKEYNEPIHFYSPDKLRNMRPTPHLQAK